MKIDVCRRPVHLKEGYFFLSVLFDEESCSFNDKSSFCKEASRIFNILEQEAFIFANGDKENLEDDHGKIQCVYDILDKYLHSKKILSLYDASDEKSPKAESEEITHRPVLEDSPQRIEGDNGNRLNEKKIQKENTNTKEEKAAPTDLYF